MEQYIRLHGTITKTETKMPRLFLAKNKLHGTRKRKEKVISNQVLSKAVKSVYGSGGESEIRQNQSYNTTTIDNHHCA